MVKMFHGCHLVHADLSEYNILWYENKCWIIDVGQAVEPTHPHALHFLHRDCTNIIRQVERTCFGPRLYLENIEVQYLSITVTYLYSCRSEDHNKS